MVVGATPNALIGAVVGVAFALTGIVAFAISAGSHFATSPGHGATGLGGLHCGLYVVVGLGLLAAAATGRARSVNTVVGATYLVAGVVLLALFDGEPQLLMLHEPDNVAHLAGAALLLGFGSTSD